VGEILSTFPNARYRYIAPIRTNKKIGVIPVTDSEVGIFLFCIFLAYFVIFLGQKLGISKEAKKLHMDFCK
jgi:hypothetical protein